MISLLFIIAISLASLGILIYCFRKAGKNPWIIALAVGATFLFTASFRFYQNISSTSSPVAQSWVTEEEATSALQSWVTETGQSGEWTVTQTEDGYWVILRSGSFSVESH